MTPTATQPTQHGQAIARSRRDMIIAVGTVAVAGIALAPLRARAQERVDPGEDLAASLSYVHESEIEGQTCANCAFYADASAEWAGCQIFAGREVKGTGVCTSWVPAG